MPDPITVRAARGEQPPPANDDDEGVNADRILRTAICMFLLGLITAGVIVAMFEPDEFNPPVEIGEIGR